MFFDLQMNICESFPNLSPFDIRKQRYTDVLLLVRRLNKRTQKQENTTHYKKVDGKTRCYVPVKQ